MTRVTIDRELCIGSGNCVHFVPEVFSLDADGIAAARKIDDREVEAVEVAVSQCPTGAITLDEH